jgi:hypothetical protein
MNLFWLLRMKRWVQHPPSPKMLKLIAFVVLASFALYFYEQAFGWPEWLTVNKLHRP